MTISGEVVYPGSYSINDGETILSIIERAGGLKDTAYTLGSVFTREEVAEIQKRGYLKSADILEKALAEKVLSISSNANPMSVGFLKEFINELKTIEPTGRQIVEIDAYLLRSDPGLNFSVHDGDNLYIPQRTRAISVMGEVGNQSTHLYRDDLTIYDYIDLSGGLGPMADKSKIYIIKPNGQSMIIDNKLFGGNPSNSLLPGSTIFVTQKMDSFNWMELTSIITPILSDLALSAAAIAAISNN